MAANLHIPFANVVLNRGDIVTGTIGGPEFSTDTTTNHGGFEQRNANWLLPLGRWELGQRGYCQSTKDYLLSFFRQRRGRYQGFLWRDLSDWQASAAPTPSLLGFTTQGLIISTGPNTAQLIKRYSDGTFVADRPIYKPFYIAPTAPQGWQHDGDGVFVGSGFLPDTPISFDFDTPVRFDTDALRISLRSAEGHLGEPGFEAIYDVESLPIVELRRIGVSDSSGGLTDNGSGGGL